MTDPACGCGRSTGITSGRYDFVQTGPTTGGRLRMLTLDRRVHAGVPGHRRGAADAKSTTC